MAPQTNRNGIPYVRTPEARFADMPDFPYEPGYVDVDGFRMAFIDEGPRDATTLLLLHGEPTWSYLYRRMIPTFLAAGLRVVAPDIIGFGRSDKPTERSAYTYAGHVAWMTEFLASQGLSDLTLFCQDWGGLIGLRLVARFPERFAGVIAANTGLPAGGVAKAPLPFRLWLAFSQHVPRLAIGWLISKGCVRGLTPAEKAAYDAPFPDETYKAGARVFPALVPITDAHASVAECRQAWTVLERFDKPVLTAFGDRDPITRGQDRLLQARIPGAQGQPHATIRRAGHFLQEDQPAELTGLIDAMIGRARQA